MTPTGLQGFSWCKYFLQRRQGGAVYVCNVYGNSSLVDYWTLLGIKPIDLVCLQPSAIPLSHSNSLLPFGNHNFL